MVRACSCMANTSCNWCQQKEDKLNFVTMSTFSDKSLQFSEKLTRFMGFLFCGTHCIGQSLKNVKLIYRVPPPPPKKKKNPGTVDFSGLCSDQQLSSFTLLDRASSPHYNDTKIVKFGLDCHFRDLPDFQSSEARLMTASAVHKLSEYCVQWFVYVA